MSRYQNDPTFFPRDRGEVSKKRQRARDEAKRYAATHSAEETKRHLRALRYPSGRWSQGGANRSSNTRREVAKKTIAVTLCVTCGGAPFEVAILTSLFPYCTCL